MPSFFVEDGTDRVELGDGFWVELKKAMSYQDLGRLTADADGLPSNVDLMLVNIVDWNLTDEGGEVAPVTRETVGRLRADVAARLLREIVARNPFLASTT